MSLKGVMLEQLAIRPGTISEVAPDRCRCKGASNGRPGAARAGGDMRGKRRGPAGGIWPHQCNPEACIGHECWVYLENGIGIDG